jgi:hypothetical protein
MGVTDGTIMAIIMIVHIAKTNNRSMGPHAPVLGMTIATRFHVSHCPALVNHICPANKGDGRGARDNYRAVLPQQLGQRYAVIHGRSRQAA